ncbi:MAG TPA: S49 family peptidase [bacterium]|nr:S49 family peptidase [bacterium]
MSKYPQIIKAISEAPWAILPEKLAVIRELIAFRAEGHRLTDEEIQARIGVAPQRQAAVTQGSVAILPLFGVMVPRASLMSDISGGTSVEGFSAMFAAAVNDPQVDAILLNIDSPGGLTDLVPELAAQIRGARGQKPIVAIANTDAASAAYWVAAQADEVVVTPSGKVGSIGVFAAHEDISAMEEKLGVKTTLVSAGRFKTEMSPFEPLSDEARAALQARVDTVYEMFVNDVAAGRRVTPDAVRGGFGEGRLVTASDALREGMVDGVATLEESVTRLARSGAVTSTSAAFAMATSSNSTANFQVRYARPPGEPAAGPIASHSTVVVDEPWDGPGQVAACPAERGALRRMHAWVDDDSDPGAKSSYKFPHHMMGDDMPGPANVNGIRNGLARLPQANIPDADRVGVERHLRRHLDDFNDQAAMSGLSFTDEADALRDRTSHLVDRATSLAEVERGGLTVAKRERLTACTGELRGAAQKLDELLAATDSKRTAELLRQRARYERQRNL